jgi:ribosome-binding protein aMBF1 (putative translation factor)
MWNASFKDALRDPVLCALAVLQDRICTLPTEDREDLYDATKALISADDEEEQASATQAMYEILEQQKPTIRKMELPAGSCDELKKWTGFVSRRIRDARKAVKLTQAELAAAAGIQQSHISRIERGEHSPTRLTLERIAKATGYPLKHFDPSADE